MATRTCTEEQWRKRSSREEDENAFHNSATSNDSDISKDSQSAYQKAKSFSCLIKSNRETRHFWKTPIKFFHIAARELSVLLILIETLILLGGYLMILGVHHSIRYCLSKLRHKTFPNESPSYVHVRNPYQPARAPTPRRVPRGRMAGG